MSQAEVSQEKEEVKTRRECANTAVKPEKKKKDPQLLPNYHLITTTGFWGDPTHPSSPNETAINNRHWLLHSMTYRSCASPNCVMTSALLMCTKHTGTTCQMSSKRHRKGFLDLIKGPLCLICLRRTF